MPSSETTPTDPSLPPDTNTETGNYIAGQDNGNTTDREKKYPESQWPPNLWK